MIGKTLRNYRITEKIGVGGQGTVYKAIDQKLGRTVVVKVLPAELTVKEANLKRFEREARLASSLDHPNICTIFDMDEADGLHFITMQYVEGRNVRQWLEHLYEPTRKILTGKGLPAPTFDEFWASDGLILPELPDDGGQVRGLGEAEPFLHDAREFVKQGGVGVVAKPLVLKPIP